MIESTEAFVRLRTSEDREDYLRAAHDEAPVDFWRDVIARFPEMREWVAHNKTVPLEILEVLASDADTRVRSAVAMKRKLDLDLFERLARDADNGVRERIACNAKAPAHLIERLAGDPAPFVRAAALARQRDVADTENPVASAEIQATRGEQVTRLAGDE